MSEKEEEEGKQAAIEGADFTVCPYTYGNSGVPMRRYLTEGWEAKRNAWFKGWVNQLADTAEAEDRQDAENLSPAPIDLEPAKLKED